MFPGQNERCRCNFGDFVFLHFGVMRFRIRQREKMKNIFWFGDDTRKREMKIEISKQR